MSTNHDLDETRLTDLPNKPKMFSKVFNESKASISQYKEGISSFDENVGDIKSQFESYLTEMRDDIYRKEREI